MSRASKLSAQISSLSNDVSSLSNDVRSLTMMVKQQQSQFTEMEESVKGLKNDIDEIKKEQKIIQRHLRDLDDAVPAPFSSRDNFQDRGYERNQFNRGASVDGFQTGSRSKLTVLSDLNIG